MKRFAILGYPLGHTLSPKLHRLLAEQLGEQIEYSICAIPPEELEEHFEELFCMDGFNITIPYKVRLMEQLDRLDTSPASKICWAVCCRSMGCSAVTRAFTVSL